MTKKTGGAASAASVGGVAATSTASTASNPSLENQTPAPPVDSTASTGAADQPNAPPDQSGDGAGNTESKATDSAAGASLENQTPAPPVDSTASAGVDDQPKAPPDPSSDGAGKSLVWADEASGMDEESSDMSSAGSGTAPAAPAAPVLDLWVLNSGVKAITESRTRTLLAVDRTTQIKISSPQVRATVIRNLEQLNHLAGAEYLKVVEQPSTLDKVE